MIPLPLAVAFYAHARARARGASPARTMPPLGPPSSNPALHLALRAPHAPAAPGSKIAPRLRLISQGEGVHHPTPQETAEAVVQKSMQEAQALLAQANARFAACVSAHPRPPTKAQPADVAAWLKLCGANPRTAFPEWDWKVIQKSPIPLGQVLGQLFEPGEAFALVQLGPHDGVSWFVHPSGAWSYDHVWGESWTDVVSDTANAIGSALKEASQVVGEAVKVVQTIASVVPGVGQIVNGIVTAAETALEALEGDSALQIALQSAYHAALAAVPGAEALAPILDPVIDTLKTIAGGKSAITKAALGALLQQVPDSPSVGDLSPRSVASSLATWLASKVGLA